MWKNRLFYYAEYVGTVPFDKVRQRLFPFMPHVATSFQLTNLCTQAMEEYATKPGVADWEALMHSYQAKIPGTDIASDVWWQPCREVYHMA